MFFVPPKFPLLDKGHKVESSWASLSFDVLEFPSSRQVGIGPNSILLQGSTTVFLSQMAMVDLKILINMIMYDESYSHFPGARQNKHINYMHTHN